MEIPGGVPAEQQAIRFLLDGKVHEVTGVEPTCTVLNYLREHLGRTGTKEGCAEGDCGACTVVLAETTEQAGGTALRYRAVNSCIQFLPTLDGKALITVEDLQRRGEPDGGAALHPVQQAMADGHGSQCGFCTPGFVMSLFALYKSERCPDRARVNEVLAGNLCRCTGYRPIVDAAAAMYPLGEKLPDEHADWLGAPCGDVRARDSESACASALRDLRSQRGSRFEYQLGGQRFFSPRTTAELADLRQRLPQARLLAGGTDVGLWVTKQHRELGDLIYVGEVTEMKRIVETARHIDIGAAVALSDVMDVLASHHADLGVLLRRFASPPIRNAGTLGGNIANGSPIGDAMPALIALGTNVVLRRGDVVRELALEDFYLDYQKNAMQPGEFLERIRVPLPPPGQAFRTYKVSKRLEQDISSVCGAFAAVLVGDKVADIRIAFGGMAAIPKRAAECERALAGRSWTAGSVAAALPALERDYAPISDMRASARYRRTIAANLLRKFFIETSSEILMETTGVAPPATRVADIAEGT
ncbi:MAG: xanthine dehydrogenase small subunit [Betaproteobacteria bacterium]|nr:xanthine dehydrogenase small subunit [Betaproteobacteria bacterium]